MTHTITFHSRRGLWGVFIVAAAGALFEAIIFSHDGARAALLALPWPLAVTALTAWLWAWPRTTLGPGGVRVRNLFRTTSFPWSELTAARSDLGLYLWVDERKYFAGAPPARGGVRRDLRRNPPTMPTLDDTATVHHKLDIEPVIAAQIITSELDRYRNPEDRPLLPTATKEAIRVNLEAAPIPAEMDADFPSTTTSRWNVLPPLVVTGMFVLAIVATRVL